MQCEQTGCNKPRHNECITETGENQQRDQKLGIMLSHIRNFQWILLQIEQMEPILRGHKMLTQNSPFYEKGGSLKQTTSNISQYKRADEAWSKACPRAVSVRAGPAGLPPEADADLFLALTHLLRSSSPRSRPWVKI